MPKKDFTEYERDTRDFTKKPLSKDFQKLIFPPESDVKKSEDHDPSVLPTSKLSMRKRALLFSEEKKLIADIASSLGQEAAQQAEDFYGGIRDGVNKEILKFLRRFLSKRDDEPSKFLKEQIEEYLIAIASTKTPKKLAVINKKYVGILEDSDYGERLQTYITSASSLEEALQKIHKRLIRDEYAESGDGLEVVDEDKGIWEISGNFLHVHLGTESSTKTPKKLAVGDKILTSSKKEAKVVKVGTELAFWMTVDGKDFGSDFISDIELIGPTESAVPVEGGMTKEVPLEEKVDLGENI